jgi:hypothetical protein
VAGILTLRASQSGRELPLGADRSAPSEKFEWLTAGDDQMIEGADIHQLQGSTDL